MQTSVKSHMARDDLKRAAGRAFLVEITTEENFEGTVI